MTFDTTSLDAACLDIGDDVILVTSAGPKPITAVISVVTAVTGSDGYNLMTEERISAETTREAAAGISRGDKLIHESVNYAVLGWSTDATGWITIELEKA